MTLTARLLPIVIALLALPAAARQSVVLAWKWTEGDERRYIIESKLDHTIQTEGVREPTEIDVTHTFHVIEKVVTVDEDGIATVTQTYQRVAVRGSIDSPDGDETFDWDSALRTGTAPATNPRTRPRPGSTPRPTADDDKDHPMVAPYAALAGRVITYRIDSENNVLSCTGADESMEGMMDALTGSGGSGGDGNLNPAIMLFKAAVNNDTLRAQFQSSLNLIPNREVRRGESWDLSVSHTLPLVGELHTDMECRLTSVSGRPGSQRASIDNKGGMSLHGGPAGTSSLGGLFQLSLGSSDMSGDTEFDAGGGYITRSTQRSVSEWEIYAPDFSDMDRLGEPIKSEHRIQQDVSMRLER